MRKNWFATLMAVCLASGWSAAHAQQGAAPSAAFQMQRPQRSWTDRIAHPFGGQPTAAEVRRKAGLSAQADSAQRMAVDPLALSKGTGEPTPELMVSMAELSDRGGNVPQARAFYQRALAIDAKHPKALLGAARLEDRDGNLDIAVMLYRRAADAQPNNPTVLNDLGLCLARQGQIPAAEQALGRAVQLEPTKPLYRNNIAKVHVELNKIDIACRNLAAVYTPPVVNYNMGVMLYQRGRLAEAERFLTTAIAIDSNMMPARTLLSVMRPAPPTYQMARAPGSQNTTVTPGLRITPTPETATPETSTADAPSESASPQIIETSAPPMPSFDDAPTLLPPVM